MLAVPADFALSINFLLYIRFIFLMTVYSNPNDYNKYIFKLIYACFVKSKVTNGERRFPA